VVAAADSTTAKTMSNTANVACLAIFDVYVVSEVLMLAVLLPLSHC